MTSYTMTTQAAPIFTYLRWTCAYLCVILFLRIKKSLLRSMITKGSQNTGGMKPCCHIWSLIWQIKISNFSNIIIKEQHITGLNVTMNNVRWCLFVQIFKASCSSYRNFYPLCPWQNRPRLCTFNTLPSCI